MVSTNQDRRALYRLQYPPGDRPRATLADVDYAVTEISEGGLRLVLQGQAAQEQGPPLSGRILFHDGEEVEIHGQVLRTDGEELVLRLCDGISLRRMVTEQHWLQKRYPQRFSAQD